MHGAYSGLFYQWLNFYQERDGRIAKRRPLSEKRVQGITLHLRGRRSLSCGRTTSPSHQGVDWENFLRDLRASIPTGLRD